MIKPTARELEILTLIWEEGLKHVAIAKQLGISPRTVSNVLSNLYNKLGTDDQVTACRLALEKGWLELAAHEHTVVHYCTDCDVLLKEDKIASFKALAR